MLLQRGDYSPRAVLASIKAQGAKYDREATAKTVAFLYSQILSGNGCGPLMSMLAM